MLDAQEIEQYRNDGYVIPRSFRLSESEVRALQLGIEAVLDRNPNIAPDRLINCHLHGCPPYGVDGFDGFADLARDARILDMVQQIIGPNIILWSTHLFCKPPVGGREVPWHQDGQYWPIRPLATCSAWVALDKVDQGNGAMRVIPGSHERGDFAHYVDQSPQLALNQVVEPWQLDEAQARYLELEPGQLSLHDVQLLHGSAANQSGRRRAGLVLRYMPATSALRRDIRLGTANYDWSIIPIELVRGKNQNAANDFEVGHAN